MGEGPSLLYCAGLPFVRERPLTTEELVRVRQWARSLSLRSLVWVAGIPGAAIVLIVGGTLTKREEWVSAALFAAFILVYTNLTALALRANNLARLWRLSHRERSVLAFEGRLTDARSIDPTRATLFVEGLLERTTEIPQTIEIFGHSGLVWLVNGKNPPRAVSASMAELTALPDSARIAARWTVALPNLEHVAVRERSLSREECKELSNLARRFLPSKQVVLWISCAIFLAAIAGRHGVNALLAETPFWLLLIWWYRSIVRLAILSLRLFRHSRAGRALIVRALDAGQDSPTPEGGAMCEYLSGSDYLWTIEGAPASWRGVRWSSWKEIEKERRSRRADP